MDLNAPHTAFTLLSYAISGLALAVLVLSALRRARMLRRRLAETRQANGDNN